MDILIVDDDPLIAEFVRRALADEGHEVRHAEDGAAGLAAAADTPPDAVILDVLMPGMSGLEVAERLRRGHPGLPILMLTSQSGTADVVRGLDAGADDYLVKPFAVEELKARVRAIGRRADAGRPERVAVGALTLDRPNRRAYVRDQRLRLTPREFGLLECLMAKAERAVPRETLLERVWEMPFDPGSNVVDVHVARLRRKLEKADSDAVVVTVRGVGYAVSTNPAALTDA